MDFNEFKRRMIEKLARGGCVIDEDDQNDPEYLAFLDRAAEIYLGVMIYSEFVNEQAVAQMEKEKAALLARMQQPSKGQPN